MRGLLLDLTPLRGREFRLLFIGQMVSFFGSMITFVALPFQMYELTESTLAVGALGVCEFIPIVTVALVSGALADAVDRRTLVRVSELGSAVVVAALLANSLLGDPQVWVLFVCAALLAGFYALLRPPLDALVPRIVPREQLKAAMALEWLRSDVGMIAGPAIGGVLIAAFDVPVTYGIDVATFLVSLGFLSLMRASPPPPDADAPSLRSIAEGLRFARSRPELIGTYLVDINAMFFGMPQALFPAIAAGLRRRRGAGADARRAGGRLAARGAVQRLDQARPSPRPRGRAGRVRLGARDHRLRLRRRAVAGARVPGGGGRDGRGLGPVPQRDLERDDPRPIARTAGRRRDDLLHLRPHPGQLRGGRAGLGGGRAGVGRLGRRDVRGRDRRDPRVPAGVLALRRA